jgi:hypothetical protein
MIMPAVDDIDRRRQIIAIPPFTWIVWPVTQPASLEAR